MSSFAQAQRRSVLKASGAAAILLSLGLLSAEQARAMSRPAGFEARSLQDALRAVGGVAASSDQIRIVSPDLAENGAVVPITVSSTLPNTSEMFILVEKNPTPLVAAFTFAAGVEAEVQTRIRMGQSSPIVVVVRANGRLFSAAKQTNVILGGCGA